MLWKRLKKFASAFWYGISTVSMQNVDYKAQWNLDITRWQWTSESFSLQRGIHVRNFPICFTITGVRKIVRYFDVFVI